MVRLIEHDFKHMFMLITNSDMLQGRCAPVQPLDAVALLVVKVRHFMHPHQQQVGVPAADAAAAAG
jgi:hypothetical protein